MIKLHDRLLHESFYKTEYRSRREITTPSWGEKKSYYKYSKVNVSSTRSGAADRGAPSLTESQTWLPQKIIFCAFIHDISLLVCDTSRSWWGRCCDQKGWLICKYYLHRQQSKTQRSILNYTSCCRERIKSKHESPALFESILHWWWLLFPRSN